MKRTDARKIAETITNEQLQQMFDKAKANISNWEATSSVNKGMTKGMGWNILAKDFDVSKEHHILAKTNMVKEFGEFLPDALKPQKKKRLDNTINPVHQDPIFD